MASGNGTTEHGVNGESLTPHEFEAMVDASEKPKGIVTPIAEKKQAKVRAPAAATAAPEVLPATIQAAREELYTAKTVPVPLRPIFNRLPPEEIIFIIAHVEHAYQTGLHAGAANKGASEPNECGHDLLMAKYDEVISGLLQAVQAVEGEDPNVDRCLRLADKAFRRLQAPA
jgi:hypothetical protein